MPTAWLTQRLERPESAQSGLQALIALGRLGAEPKRRRRSLPLTSDADPVIRHIAVRALTRLQADRRVPGGARRQRRRQSAPFASCRRFTIRRSSNALIARSTRPTSAEQQQLLLPALCRLYFEEARLGRQMVGHAARHDRARTSSASPGKNPKRSATQLKRRSQAQIRPTQRLLAGRIEEAQDRLPGREVALLKAAPATIRRFGRRRSNCFCKERRFRRKRSTSCDRPRRTAGKAGLARQGPARAAQVHASQSGFLPAALAGFAALTPKDWPIRNLPRRGRTSPHDVKHAGRVGASSRSWPMPRTPPSAICGWRSSSISPPVN